MRRLPAALFLALLLPFTAHAAPVALVLQEDPPLPGASLVGWEALDPAAASHPDDVLDLGEAVSTTLANSPAIRALEADVSAARADLIDARAFPNPTWELALFSSEHPERKLPLAVGAELDVSAMVLAVLRARGVRPAVEAAQIRADEGTLRLAYEARAAFYDHQAALAAWGASLRSVDALAASRDVARAITLAGNAPARELVLREIAYEEARMRAAEIELNVVATRERLTRLLGTPPGAVRATLTPAPVTLSIPEDVEAAAVTASREIASLDADLRAGRRSRTAARVAGYAPDLAVRVESERLDDAWGTSAGIEVKVPLFSYGRGDVLRAGAGIDRLTAQRDQAEIDVRSAARESRVRLESAHRRALHHQDVIVPAKERALDETLRHYNAMQVDTDVLLDAWRDRVEAEIALADTLRELWTAQAALDALLAGARVDAPRNAASPLSLNSSNSGGH